MSNFSCSNDLIVRLMRSTFFIMLFLQAGASMVAVEGEHILNNQLYSNEDEMVQIAGYGVEKLSTVIVTGSVVCEACFHGEPHLRQWQIPGARVVVQCQTRRGDGKKMKSSRIEGVTDEFGDFIVDLPSHLHAIPKLEKACSLRVVALPNKSICIRPNYIKKREALTLSSVGNGIRTYNAGQIKFQHGTSRPLRACMH